MAVASAAIPSPRPVKPSRSEVVALTLIRSGSSPVMRPSAWRMAEPCGPTFGASQQTVEVHLFDFDGDLYGQRLRVDFIERLRAERQFASVEDLVRQIGRDVDRARAILAEE